MYWRQLSIKNTKLVRFIKIRIKGKVGGRNILLCLIMKLTLWSHRISNWKNITIVDLINWCLWFSIWLVLLRRLSNISVLLILKHNLRLNCTDLIRKIYLMRSKISIFRISSRVVEDTRAAITIRWLRRITNSRRIFWCWRRKLSNSTRAILRRNTSISDQ